MSPYEMLSMVWVSQVAVLRMSTLALWTTYPDVSVTVHARVAPTDCACRRCAPNAVKATTAHRTKRKSLPKLERNAISLSSTFLLKHLTFNSHTRELPAFNKEEKQHPIHPTTVVQWNAINN